MIEIIIPVPVSHIKKHSILPDTTNSPNELYKYQRLDSKAISASVIYTI